MRKFENKEALIQAYVKAMNFHWERQGLTPNPEVNRQVAEQNLRFVHKSYAKLVERLPEAVDVYILNGFGYCEA